MSIYDQTRRCSREADKITPAKFGRNPETLYHYSVLCCLDNPPTFSILHCPNWWSYYSFPRALIRMAMDQSSSTQLLSLVQLASRPNLHPGLMQVEILIRHSTQATAVLGDDRAWPCSPRLLSVTPQCSEDLPPSPGMLVRTRTPLCRQATVGSLLEMAMGRERVEPGMAL